MKFVRKIGWTYRKARLRKLLVDAIPIHRTVMNSVETSKKVMPKEHVTKKTSKNASAVPELEVPSSKARVGKVEFKLTESLDFLVFAVNVLESLLACLGDPVRNGGFIVDYNGVKGNPEIS